MAIALKTAAGKFLKTSSGKFCAKGSSTSKVSISTGGEFQMPNGDTFYIGGIGASGDIYISLASGESMSAIYDWGVGTQQTGNGWIGDYGTSIIKEGAQLRVYVINPYEYGWDEYNYPQAGLSPDLILEIQGSYWVQIK